MQSVILKAVTYCSWYFRSRASWLKFKSGESTVHVRGYCPETHCWRSRLIHQTKCVFAHSVRTTNSFMTSFTSMQSVSSLFTLRTITAFSRSDVIVERRYVLIRLNVEKVRSADATVAGRTRYSCNRRQTSLSSTELGPIFFMCSIICATFFIRLPEVVQTSCRTLNCLLSSSCTRSSPNSIDVIIRNWFVAVSTMKQDGLNLRKQLRRTTYFRISVEYKILQCQ